MTPESVRVPLLCALIAAGVATDARTQTQAPASAARPMPVAFSSNGQQLNNMVGRGVALADVNRDGALDAFVVNESGWQRHEGRVYLGDGRGQFTDSGQRLEGATGGAQPVVHDVDGNGSPDVIVGRTVWVNDGRGRFVPDTSRVVDADGDWIRQCSLGDLNGDGWPDLIGIVLTARGSAARVYLNDKAGHFRDAGEALRIDLLAAVELGDVNADGFLDAVVSGWRNQNADACPNRILLNDGSGMFTDSGVRLGADWSWQLAVADINGDRLPDVFVVNLGVDRTAPPERMMQGRVAEVWLNAEVRR